MNIDSAYLNYLNRVNGQSVPGIASGSEPGGVEKVDFSKAFNDAMEKINATDSDSVKTGELLAAGKLDNPHDLTIAATKAELTLSYALEVKNRVIESYREIMRMQF